ncbi:MAG: septal ring lytic transglycosylase RlpA family protein [Conexibacteraceae bacterium]|nr:septal ring lytic transglycosylase RlpA family protein [Conexibacteraceae bacterium]
MRANRILGAPVAAKLAVGALAVTLSAAGAIVVSDPAIAFGAQTTTTTTTHASTTTTPASTTTTSTRRPARKRHIETGLLVSHFVINHPALAEASGSTVVVRGRLMPDGRRAQVKLLAREGRRWRALASGRTRRNGRFGIPYRVEGGGSTHLRVRYAGGRGARAVSAAAGQVTALTPAVASWYYDAGNTACGFHAYYGVANKTLPCGTHVTISYGGRSVVATVDDRGPYVYGRSFDLNQNISRYLGMYGVATVLTSI